MTKRFGPMDIDFRVRCVKPNDDFDRIYYGHTAAEYDAPGADKVYDLTENYSGLSRGGRHVGTHREPQKHFFNKRVFFDGETIQGRGYAAGVGARDGEGSTCSAQEVEAGEGSAGGGDQGASSKGQGNEEGEVV